MVRGEGAIGHRVVVGLDICEFDGESEICKERGREMSYPVIETLRPRRRYVWTMRILCPGAMR